MSETIAVIGDGGMGTVCAIMLAENGHTVRLWSAFSEQAADMRATRENRKYLPGYALPDNITPTSSPEEAFADVDWILSAVPTQFTRAVWGKLVEACPAGVPVCSVTKGIENKTLRRPSEILSEVLGQPERPIAVLSGPSIAPEIADKKPATVTVASTDIELAERVQDAITRTYFRVYTNIDMIGVELAGATKNVIAIAAGILDGMAMGDNAKAALLTRGLAEIVRLGQAAGAQTETFYGLAGVGDLVTTCISPVGRNRTFGQAIGSGKSVDEALATIPAVVEGVPTTRSVVELAGKLGIEMPLTEALYKVLFEGLCPSEAILGLMSRPPRAELQS